MDYESERNSTHSKFNATANPLLQKKSLTLKMGDKKVNILKDMLMKGSLK